jgi:hypothetical protein
MSEKELVAKFKAMIEKDHPNWRVQTEVPIGSLTADGRIVEVDDKEVVRLVIAYFEVKDDVDAGELLKGYGQATYYAERAGTPAWLVLPHPAVNRFILSEKKVDPRVKIFDADENKLHETEEVTAAMSKSRMKRKLETSYFQPWSQNFEIEVTTPLAITSPEFDDDSNVLLNIGPRMRGAMKEMAKTISATLSESVKYAVVCEPYYTIAGKRNDLLARKKFIPDKRTGKSKGHDFFELAPPRRFSFTVRCTEPRLTPEIVENLLRQAGTFTGIGDSHSDGYHGRYILLNQTNP